MNQIARPLALATLALMVVGCGGGGSGTNTTGSGTCGPDFLTPNYIQAVDPGSNQPNRARFWTSFPLNVRFTNDETFDDNGTSVSAADQSRIAMARWESAADGANLFEETTSSSNAKITVTFNQIANAPGSGGTLGSTVVSFFPSNNQLIDAEITINIWPNMTRAQFIDGLRKTIAHEFGHALYLQGHSDESEDVMYYQTNPSIDFPLTTRDINTFKTAYCGEFTQNLTTRALPNETPVRETITCPGH